MEGHHYHYHHHRPGPPPLLNVATPVLQPPDTVVTTRLLHASPTSPRHPALLPHRPPSGSFADPNDHPHPHPHPRSRVQGQIMMPPRLTYEYNPLSYEYPDDESDKEVFFQASGTIAKRLRTVLLYWVNMVFHDDEEEVWQVVRLDRREDDVHKYVYPDLIVVDGCAGHWRLASASASASASAVSASGSGSTLAGMSHASVEQDERTYSLGVFSRDQREALLECAEEIAYDERSGEEGQCLRWMGQLLDRMIEEGLLTRAVVDAIRHVVPGR